MKFVCLFQTDPMVTDPDTGSLAGMLPPDLLGWNAVKTIPLAVPADLYSYMDGGAELYLSYGFREAISRTYVKQGQPEVVVELYDLSEPRNAFGVFSHARETENLHLGQGACSIPGAVFFWKDKYYISISSWESAAESDDFTLALGRHIDKEITRTGNIPDLVNLLPEEGLVPFGYLYFHHYVWLNSYFYITDANLFKIDDGTNALVARYEDNDQRRYLLLIEYQDPGTTGEAFAAFAKEFFPGGLSEGCVRMKDGTWLAASHSGNVLAAVFNASSRESAGRLLTGVLKKYQTGYPKKN
jgi:hypothetical protein